MLAFKPVLKNKTKASTIVSRSLCDLENQLCSLNAKFELPSKLKQSEDGYVILTFGFIYFFNKKISQLIETIDVLYCQEISYEEKAKCIKIKMCQGQNYSIYSKSSVLHTFYDYICQIINIINSGSHIFNPQPQFKTFSIPYLMFLKSLYFIHCDMKKGIINNEKIDGVNYFNDIKNYEKEALIINSGFLLGKFGAYYAKAIATEPRISKIIFHKFNQSDNNFIELIINNAPNVQDIVFCEYNSDQQIFNLKQISNKNISQKFTFYLSHSSVFFNFINCVENSQCSINHLRLLSLDMQKSDLISFFDIMSKLKAFKNLISFTLSDVTFDDFPVDSFIQFLDAHEKLESLSLSKIKYDGTKLFSAICESEPLIYTLHMNEIEFSTQMILDDNDKQIFMPPNLVHVDFSKSRFIKGSLRPILQLLLSYCMKKNFLCVNLSHLSPSTNKWVDIFQNLDLKKCHPNIIDFDWSGNNLSKFFFDFILSQKGLQFLTMRDIHLSDQTHYLSFFQHIFTIISSITSIIGIDIASEEFEKESLIKFIQACQSQKKIEHFYIKTQKEQNEVANALSKLFYSLPKLREVNVEMPELNPSIYLKLAKSIIDNKSILAANLSNFVFSKKKEPKQAEIESIMKSIRNLKVPSTMNIRAASLISIQKKKQENSIFDLATTITMECSNHQIIEEENLDDNNNNAHEIEIEEEEEVLSDDDNNNAHEIKIEEEEEVLSDDE